MDLYPLDISLNNIEIANMLKEIMIIQYFYIKISLNNNFNNVTDLKD